MGALLRQEPDRHDLGAERLRPRLRRPAAARRPDGRHPRPPRECSSSAWACSPSAASSPASPPNFGAAARRPRDPGRRRRDRLAHRAVADHDRVRRGQGTHPRHRGVRRRVRRRRRARPAARRHPHELPQLALGAVRQRPDRHRPDRRRVPLPARVRAAARQVRLHRRAAVGRRAGRDRLRLHPRRARRLGQRPDLRRVRRRGRPAGGVRLLRGEGRQASR